MKYIKYISLLLVFLSSVANAQTVNLDSTRDFDDVKSIQSLDLGIGVYTANIIGGAWNAWGKVNGCTNGFTCNNGWLNEFSISSVELGENLFVQGSGKFSSAALALNNAPSGFRFELTQSQIVTFFIEDNNYADNIGSLTIQVSPVPEASTYALMLSGLGFVAFMIRRRKLNL